MTDTPPPSLQAMPERVADGAIGAMLQASDAMTVHHPAAEYFSG